MHCCPKQHFPGITCAGCLLALPIFFNCHTQLCHAGAVQIWTVPTRLRPLAAGMGTVTSHLFGDVPTPPLVGWVQGEDLPWTCSYPLTCSLLRKGLSQPLATPDLRQVHPCTQKACWFYTYAVISTAFLPLPTPLLVAEAAEGCRTVSDPGNHACRDGEQLAHLHDDSDGDGGNNLCSAVPGWRVHGGTGLQDISQGLADMS